MLRFDRIVLASDFSADSETALLYAAVLARQTQARLLLLHVLDTRVVAFPHWSDMFRSTEVLAAQEAAATEALERWTSHAALAGLPLETLMQPGNPATRIIDLAAPADLLVMGTRWQETGWQRRVHTIAQQVAHGSSIPVLLVPAGDGRVALPATDATALVIPRVVLALHFAQYAPQAVTLARAFAAASQAALQVLQVVDPDKATSYPLDAGSGLAHNLEALKILLRKRLAEIVADHPMPPAVERLVMTGNASEVIVKHCVAQQAGLLVMSAHPYSALKKFFTVSTVDAVIEQAPCPLLIVPLARTLRSSTTGDNGSGIVD